MIKVKYVLAVQRSASTLFTELTDFDSSYRWQTQEVLKEWHEPAGPVQIGTRGHQRRMFRGKPIETVNKIIVFEPDQRMVAESSNSRIEYVVTSEGENASRLDFSIELKLRGMANLFSSMIRRGLQKDVEARFQNLKRYLEVGETNRNSW